MDVGRGLPLLGGRGFALRVPDGQTAEPGFERREKRDVWRGTTPIEIVQKTLREGLIGLGKGRDSKGINEKRKKVR